MRLGLLEVKTLLSVYILAISDRLSNNLCLVLVLTYMFPVIPMMVACSIECLFSEGPVGIENFPPVPALLLVRCPVWVFLYFVA